MYMGLDRDGRQIRRSRTFRAASLEDAERQAREWRDGLTVGGRVRSTALSDLMERRIGSAEAAGASPNSLKAYRLYTGYARRFFGTRPAAGVTPVDVSNFVYWMLTDGRKAGGGLSPTTAAGAFQFLRQSYRQLVAEGIVASNPTADVEKPKPVPHEAMALAEADLAALVGWLDETLEGDAGAVERCRAFGISIALRTGMRCGEVCALRPRDVSAARGYIHVGGNVVAARGERPARRDRAKTARSHRNVSITDADVEAVRAHVSWMRSHVPGFGTSSPLTGPSGEFVSPDSLSEAFRSVRDRLGIDRRATFHTLRHTHASWCLAEGVDLVTLSERLGHADPSTTARIYGHMIVGRDKAAASAFADLVERVRDGGEGW